MPPSTDKSIFVARIFLVKNRDVVIEMVQHYGNVKAVFQGHAHRFDVQTTTVKNGTGALNTCQFIIAPPIIEYPFAWLMLSLTKTTLTIHFNRLPLPQFYEVDRHNGEGQIWRDGLPEWHDYTIDYIAISIRNLHRYL